MSTAQLRDAVLRTESVVERIHSFIDQRVAKVAGPPTQNRPYWMLHVIPLVRTSLVFDVTDQQVINRLRKIEAPVGGSGTHSIDGYKVGYRDNEGLISHSLVFRDGTVEFLDQGCFTPRPNGVNYLACGVFDDRLFDLLGSALALYSDGLLQFPAVVAVTVQNIKGYCMPPVSLAFDRTGPIEENAIAPEPMLVTEIPEDLRAFLRPVLDYIWNAFGLARCQGYDATGKYIGYR